MYVPTLYTALNFSNHYNYTLLEGAASVRALRIWLSACLVISHMPTWLLSYLPGLFCAGSLVVLAE